MGNGLRRPFPYLLQKNAVSLADTDRGDFCTGNQQTSCRPKTEQQEVRFLIQLCF